MVLRTQIVAALFTLTAITAHSQQNAVTETSSIAGTPILCFREVQHSMKFLSFFTYYAKDLYEISNTEFLRDLFPIVITTQSLVYTADYEIEESQKNGPSDLVHPWLKQKTILMKILKEFDLYTIDAEREADLLTEYWTLENELMSGAEITKEKLNRAILLRASDIMILHKICEKKLGIEFPQKAWSALQDIEVLRDVEADLRQYEKDVINNDFNIYRMFIRYYGKEHAAQRIDVIRANLLASFNMKKNDLPAPFKERFERMLTRYYEQRPFIEVPEAIE